MEQPSIADSLVRVVAEVHITPEPCPSCEESLAQWGQLPTRCRTCGADRRPPALAEPVAEPVVRRAPAWEAGTVEAEPSHPSGPSLGTGGCSRRAKYGYLLG